MAWYDVITDFGSVMAETVMSLVLMVIYPIIQVANIFLSLLENIFNAIYSFIMIFVSLLDFILSSVGYVVYNLFPSTISALLITLMILVVALALIKKIKGISIFGFSLGGG